jgi:ligand-binding SRPBCC domain-containing protein
MHTLETKQVIPGTLDEIWDFFSDPSNLAVITPPDMGFRITGRSADYMYPGMIIRYRVRPLMGIPVTWVTEITHVMEKKYFVDEQRIGPYRLWHHQHHFRKVDEGIEVHDIVDYSLPLGFLGKLANRLFIRKKLDHIFDYRSEKVRERFG